MGLHPHMVVQEHELYGFQCRGLFASRLIAQGEIVCDWDLEEEERRVYYHAHDLLAVPDKEKRDFMIRYSYMVEDDVYDTTTDPDEDPSLYYNHSCDPNSWYINPRCMVALRDIQPGEQVTYDYATTETEGSMHAGLLCRCGAASCRGTLKFSEWRSRDWQQRNAGHCSAYIERKMAESGWYDPRVIPRYKGGADGSKGLFALASIGRGERVLVFAGKVAGEVVGDERTRQLSLQINESESLNGQKPDPTRGPETPELINHSSDPNCGMEEDLVTVVALRDIAPGEELSIDYGSITNSGANRTVQ